MSFLIKSLAFVLIIAGGCLLRHTGFFQEKDARLLSRIVINITLPATVIQAFSGFERETSLFFVVLLGLLGCLVPVLLYYICSLRQARAGRVFGMVNIAGYNIGCFSLPIIQNFFGDAGTVVACMLDIGNAIMVTGGTFALTTTLLKTTKEKESPWQVSKKFLSSVPFDTYMLMLVLAFLNISIPQWVTVLTAPIASANSFLAMLMIGILLKLPASRKYRSDAIRLIFLRFGWCAAFSLILFFCTPFSLFTRQVLAVLAFSPISSLAPTYTQRCGGDGSLASFANSISIVIGLVTMTLLPFLMGIVA